MPLPESSVSLKRIRKLNLCTLYKLAEIIGVRERYLYRVQNGDADGRMSPLRILLYLISCSPETREVLGL